jgi:dihydrofolate reductase
VGETGPQIVFYLARADNGVIGSGGRIPWRIPGEQRRFKEMTMGKPMVMGRKTFESFPAPLPGRRHIVLTRSGWSAAGAEVVRDKAEALALVGEAPQIAIIGGSGIFDLFRGEADRIELTEVHCAPEGDAIVPAFDPETWRETAREDHPAEEGRPGFSYVTLVRL